MVEKVTINELHTEIPDPVEEGSAISHSALFVNSEAQYDI